MPKGRHIRHGFLVHGLVMMKDANLELIAKLHTQILEQMLRNICPDVTKLNVQDWNHTAHTSLKTGWCFNLEPGDLGQGFANFPKL